MSCGLSDKDVFMISQVLSINQASMMSLFFHGRSVCMLVPRGWFVRAPQGTVQLGGLEWANPRAKRLA